MKPEQVYSKTVIGIIKRISSEDEFARELLDAICSFTAFADVESGRGTWSLIQDSYNNYYEYFSKIKEVS